MYSAVFLPGRMPGMKPPYFRMLSASVDRVEDDRHVEVAEEDDGDDLEQVVERLPVATCSRRPSAPTSFWIMFAITVGTDDHGAGEDDRDDAAGVDAQRQVGVLAAVDLAADDALGVLHRDAPLRPLHEDDEGDDQHHEDEQRGPGCIADRLPFCTRSIVVPTAGTRPTTMPAKMISEMPLPMPRSVICSPSHMMKAVPVVSVSTVMQPEAPARGRARAARRPAPSASRARARCRRPG